MVLLEAMSTGIPCISTNVGDAKIIIGNTGWIVETSNPKDMALCLLKIINDKKLLNQKSKLVRKRIKENFSLERMNKNYKKLYI